MPVSKENYAGPTVPSKQDELFPKAQEYLHGGWRDHNTVPSIAGLACFLGYHRESILRWSKNHPDTWGDLYAKINTLQECMLIDGGLDKSFQPNFAKLLMAKHGYSEKVEVDATSSDGSMTPKSAVSVTPELAAEILKKINDEI